MDIQPTETQKNKPKVPEEMVQYLQEKGNDIIEKIFKPKYLLPVSEEHTLNQSLIFMQSGIGIVFIFVSNINARQMPIDHLLKINS